MFLRILALCSCLWGLALGHSAAEEIAPHGWSIQYSSNSLYLTRPDLPEIQVAVVSDVRPDLSQDEKFENAKTFFGNRADCPSLASTETQKSFAGYFAASKRPQDGFEPRCKLQAMGHWQEDGLQMALILNHAVHEGAAGTATGSPQNRATETYSVEAISQDITEFMMTRYQLAESGVSTAEIKSQLSPEWFAQQVPQSHKPSYMIRLARKLDAIETIIGGDLPAVLLFEETLDGETSRFAIPCADWDPAMFDPSEDGLVARQPLQSCDLRGWNWSNDDRTNPVVFYKSQEERRNAPFVVEANKNLFEAGYYRPLPRGSNLDLRIGTIQRAGLDGILSGERPLSDLGSHELALLPDGQFLAGSLRSATLENGRIEGPIQGKYHFDGHTVTFVLDSGRVIHGFAGWLENEDPLMTPPSETDGILDDNAIININGWIYSSYCRTSERVECAQ